MDERFPISGKSEIPSYRAFQSYLDVRGIKQLQLKQLFPPLMSFSVGFQEEEHLKSLVALQTHGKLSAISPSLQ